METQRIIPLGSAVVLVVAPANNQRKSVKVEALGVSTPTVTVAVRPWQTIGSAVTEIQTLTPSAVPGSGTFKISYNGVKSGALNYNDTNATIQTALRLISGLGLVTVTGTMATAVVVTMAGVAIPSEGVLTVTDNTMATAGTGDAQTISVANTPSQGSFRLAIAFEDGMSKMITPAIQYNDSAATIQTMLRLFMNDAGLTVSGSITAGFVITSILKRVTNTIAIPTESNSLKILSPTVEVQTLTPSSAPDAGTTATFSYKGATSAALAFGATATQIRNAIRATHPELSQVTVVGTFATTVVVTMTNIIAPALLTFDVGNFTVSAVAITATLTATTPYVAATNFMPFTVSHGTVGVASATVTVSGAVTTPGDSASAGYSIAQGAGALSLGDGDIKGVVYAKADGVVSVKVTEVY